MEAAAVRQDRSGDPHHVENAIEESHPATRTDDNTTTAKSSSIPASNINVVHQRRRVNPESLALRLGPQLVSDLDALIVPGNMEMPSFAVRKTLQERYNIDRRHIYDYFHSRGLRVIKEDKKGDPALSQEAQAGAAALPQLRPLRQAPLKNPPRSIATDTKWNTKKPRGLTKARPGRPRKHPIANDPTPSSGSASRTIADDCSPPSPTYYTVNPLVLPEPPSILSTEQSDTAFNSIVNPLDESFSMTRAIGDIAYSYRHKLVFDRMFELNGHALSFASDQLHMSNEASPCSASCRSILLPHVNPLSSRERQAVYQSLSDSIGPACGVQESEGTYRKYMDNRTKLYYESLLSAPFQHAQPPHRQGSTASMHRELSFVTNEFRFWLSSTEVVRRDGIHNVPKDKHALKPESTRQRIVSYDDKDYSVISSRFTGQTLDDLFPFPSQDSIAAMDVMDSPIARARDPAYLTRCLPLPEEGSDKDGDGAVNVPLSVFSTTSDATIPAPLAQLATELPRSHIKPQGVAGFTDPMELTAPAAEMEGRPKLETSPSRFIHGHRSLRKSQAHVRMRLMPCSPYKAQTRERDRVRTRSITSRGSRNRTTSAAGDI